MQGHLLPSFFPPLLQLNVKIVDVNDVVWLVVKIKSTYITVSLFYFTILIEKFHHLLLSQGWVKLKPSRLIWFSCEWLWCHASTWTLLVVVTGIFHSQFFMFCWRAATFALVFIRILMHSRSGGKTRNVVECFSLHLRAVAASCVLYNRTERRQGFSICFI